MSMGKSHPRLAVWKFASCDGCQLTLLNCEDQLLDIAAQIDIAYFPEATKGDIDGPYDLSLVEGSVTTEHDAQRILEIRAMSETLITIGACATSGGIQALRNFSNITEFTSIVYANPGYITTLDMSTPISDHIDVEFELRGCPISKGQLIEVIDAYLNGRKPNTPSHSVCVECKLHGTPCVMVSHRTPCMGPITQAGCGAICPSFNRGCYGCFGPSETANVASLIEHWQGLGVDDRDVLHALRTFNAAATEYQEASANYAR